MSMPALEEQFRESACYGDVDAMSSLLKAGVNVNSVNKMNGWTALHWACKVSSNNIPATLITHYNYGWHTRLQVSYGTKMPLLFCRGAIPSARIC